MKFYVLFVMELQFLYLQDELLAEADVFLLSDRTTLGLLFDLPCEWDELSARELKDSPGTASGQTILGTYKISTLLTEALIHSSLMYA